MLRIRQIARHLFLGDSAPRFAGPDYQRLDQSLVQVPVAAEQAPADMVDLAFDAFSSSLSVKVREEAPSYVSRALPLFRLEHASLKSEDQSNRLFMVTLKGAGTVKSAAEELINMLVANGCLSSNTARKHRNSIGNSEEASGNSIPSPLSTMRFGSSRG